VKKLITIVVVGLILLIIAGYRYWQVFPYPMGGGQIQQSPNKQFRASASTLTDRYFFGGERRYYEFLIETDPRERLRRIVIEEPPEGLIQWRGNGTIVWAADSSAVTFTFGGTQLILNIKP
jgi:hypothetical protein